MTYDPQKSRASWLAHWLAERKKRLLSKGWVNPPLDAFSSAVGIRRTERDAPGSSMERFFQTLDDGVTFDAPARLHHPSWISSDAGLRLHDRANWDGVDIHLAIFAARVIEVARRKGIPLYVHAAMRTQFEQNELVQKGVSKAKWPNAPHPRGAAVDIVHAVFHWSMTKQEWALLGVLGKQVARRMRLDVTWGGDWRFYDPAHWELTDWRSRDLPTLSDPLRQTPRGILAKHKGLIR